MHHQVLPMCFKYVHSGRSYKLYSQQSKCFKWCITLPIQYGEPSSNHTVPAAAMYNVRQLSLQESKLVTTRNIMNNWSTWVINSLVKNFFFLLLINRKQLTPISSEKERKKRGGGDPGGWSSQILRQLAHEGGKVVSPTHRPHLPPGNIPGTHSNLMLNWPQGHISAARIVNEKFQWHHRESNPRPSSL
jgi:hypothetical protein